MRHGTEQARAAAIGGLARPHASLPLKDYWLQVQPIMADAAGQARGDTIVLVALVAVAWV
jgi:hypothetical protein